jgi:hypothetical protein
MGHSLRFMLEMGMACLIFVIAATAGMILFQSGTAALDATYAANRGTDRSVYTTLTPLAGDGSVTGAEVLQSVGTIGEMGVEIVVDGTVYDASLEREDANLSGIQTGSRYTVTFQRGPQGELKKMIYSSR